jgi:hypothetical protein
MLAGLTAAFLAASLILEAAFRQVTLSRWFAVAGLAFLVLAILAPSWPRRYHRPNRRRVLSNHPHFGHTRLGLAVHARVADHHPDGSAYQRFNKRVAMTLTSAVGTMTCFWLFCLLALCSLPAVLSAFAAFHGTFPDWMIRASIIALVAWVAQTMIQLVLLPALMVGQSLQNEASDARTAKTFEDIEAVRVDLTTALDRLDEKTEGGIKAVLDAVGALTGAIPEAAPAKRLATRAERGKEGSPASG